MINPFEGYEQIIHAWQELDYSKLDKVPVEQSLLPLKLFLLGREQEGSELLEEIGYQFVSNTDNAFILEARLVSTPFEPGSNDPVKMSSEVVSLFDRAYFANITLAEDAIKREDPLQAINFYQKALTIAPNSQKITSDYIYTCILGEKMNLGIRYAGLLRSRKDYYVALAGCLTLSNLYGKAGLAVFLALLSILFPWCLLVFIPGLIFFGYEFIVSIKAENKLMNYISKYFLMFLGGFLLLSLFMFVIL